MRKISYYILGWYDEGDTNRSEVLWKGTDPKAARIQFNSIDLIGNLFFVECWETCPDYDEDVRLEYKFA